MREYTPPRAIEDSFVPEPEQRLPKAAAAEFVLGAAKGSVRLLAGIDSESLRVLLDAVESNRYGRRALYVWIAPALTTEAIVEQVIELFAETARKLWPIWFTDVSFDQCRNDALGRLSANVIARSAAEQVGGLSPSWAAEAARLTLDNRAPRVRETVRAIEIGQLALAINRFGLVLVADVSAAGKGPNPAAIVQALEWIAQHIQGAVIVLLPEMPPNGPPFDRILYGARCVVIPADGAEPSIIGPSIETEDAERWIAPWRGLPHPLSDTEQQLANALSADAELASLFCFNQFVDTVRGSRPKVDLVWNEGRLVVELDGYSSHGNRVAFMYDRHRDYELALSGYTVLRLANDEIAQDIEKAIAKIRDLVCLCRMRMVSEE